MPASPSASEPAEPEASSDEARGRLIDGGIARAETL
jgi:hypothetical protein